MIPMCQYENIALTPFSPLAHGVFNKAADTHGQMAVVNCKMIIN